MSGGEGLDGLLKSVAFSVLSEAADELGTVVGLESCSCKVYIAGPEMLADQTDKEACIGGGLFIGESKEHQTASDLACGELVLWQLKGFHLRPVMRDILEVLGIDAELTEQFPLFFHLREVFLAFMLLSSLSDQAVVVENSADGLMAAGQVMFLLEAFGAHERELSAESDYFVFDGDWCLVGATEGYSRQFIETCKPFLSVTIEPLADGAWGGLEEPGGWFYSDLFSGVDHSEPKIIFVSFVWHSC